MAEARRRNQWNHTAAILALQANCHRDPKKTRTFKPADFHPEPIANRPVAKPQADITLLKQVFVDNRK